MGNCRRILNKNNITRFEFQKNVWLQLKNILERTTGEEKRHTRGHRDDSDWTISVIKRFKIHGDKTLRRENQQYQMSDWMWEYRRRDITTISR